MKNQAYFIFVAFSFYISLSALAETKSEHLALSKGEYVPGETVVLDLIGTSSIGHDPQVVLVPSSVAHGSGEHIFSRNVSYQKLDKAAKGQLFFDAPKTDGEYDLRLISSKTAIQSRQAGVEVDSVSFTVSKEFWKPQVTIKLAKTVFSPKEPIRLQYTVPHTLPNDAWVALVPAATPSGFSKVNAKHYLQYSQLHSTDNGTLIFDSPFKLGQYQLRLNDQRYDNSIELAAVTFDVSLEQWQQQTEISTDMTRYEPGDKVYVTYSLPKEIAQDAYLAVVPADVPHGNENINAKHYLEYENVNGNASGILEFTAPVERGDYDIRVHSSREGYEVMHVLLTTKPWYWFF